MYEEARAHLAELKRLAEDPGQAAASSARQKAARLRAAEGRVKRLEEAAAELAEVQRRRDRRLCLAGDGEHARKLKADEGRVSVTDPQARKMRMPDGGYSPAYNVQLAVDAASRAVVGVAVCNEGSDGANLSGPMRRQAEARTGGKVKEHLMDGGYAVPDDIAAAAREGVTVYCPPKPPRNAGRRADAFQPARGDCAEVAAWRARMGTPQAREIYKQRASTVETVNADLKTHRGLGGIGRVKGTAKALCVALWSVLAYNLMHFGRHLG